VKRQPAGFNCNFLIRLERKCYKRRAGILNLSAQNERTTASFSITDAASSVKKATRSLARGLRCPFLPHPFPNFSPTRATNSRIKRFAGAPPPKLIRRNAMTSDARFVARQYGVISEFCNAPQQFGFSAVAVWRAARIARVRVAAAYALDPRVPILNSRAFQGAVQSRAHDIVPVCPLRSCARALYPANGTNRRGAARVRADRLLNAVRNRLRIPTTGGGLDYNLISAIRELRGAESIEIVSFSLSRRAK
jgi:hypothetical protein